MGESHAPHSSEKSFHRMHGNQQASYQRCYNNIHTRDAFPICSLDEVAGYRAKNGMAEWVRLMCSLFSDNVQFWASIFWRGCQTAMPPDTLPVYVWAESEPSFWNQLENFITVTLTEEQRGCTSQFSHTIFSCSPNASQLGKKKSLMFRRSKNFNVNVLLKNTSV